MPPQVNARVTRVIEATVAAGVRDDWDTPGTEPTGAGAEKWAGDEPAYYRETVDRVAGNGELNILTRRVLYVDSHVARAMGVDTDDTITFIDPAGQQRTGQAASIAIRELAGVPAELQTARIDLEPA